MNIIVYYKSGCPWAADVMEYLKEHNLPFEGKDISSNSDFEQEVRSKSGQSKSPTLDIDGMILPDSDVDEVAKHLSSVGVH